MSETLENQAKDAKFAELCCCTFCGATSMHIVVTKQGKRMACCFDCIPTEMPKWPSYVLKTEPLPYDVRRLQHQ